LSAFFAATPAITTDTVRTRGLLRRSPNRRELFRYGRCPFLTVGTRATAGIQDGYDDTTGWAD
jgi:hypothetical protein